MIGFQKIKDSIKNIFWFIGENFFLSLFIFVFLVLIISSFIFYQYSFLVEKKEPQIVEIPLYFKEAIYQKILEEWQIRQKKFEEAEFKEYRDLFRVPIIVP